MSRKVKHNPDVVYIEDIKTEEDLREFLSNDDSDFARAVLKARKANMSSGLPFLTIDQINKEVAKNRGERE